VWNAGDQIVFTAPLRLTAEPLRDDSSQQAFLVGPIVLAGQFPTDGIGDDLMHNQGPELQELPPFQLPTLKAQGSNPEVWIRQVPGEPLHFRTVDQAENVTLKPLNQSWKRFAVYWNVV
jgi:hypothetical protein